LTTLGPDTLGEVTPRHFPETFDFQTLGHSCPYFPLYFLLFFLRQRLELRVHIRGNNVVGCSSHMGCGRTILVYFLFYFSGERNKKGFVNFLAKLAQTSYKWPS
jgi:hypothetical protein